MLQRMASLDPAPCFMGGYAEDAMLAGAVTRPHEDLDRISPRASSRSGSLRPSALGFSDFETWGEAAPGEPFDLFTQNGDLRLDLGIADEVDGANVVRIHKLFFEVGGLEAPAGYKVYLPADLFDFPPVEIEGVAIRTASPLALYQLRVGIALQGSFGPLSERQLASMSSIREKFFPDRSEADLEPRIESLP